MDVLTTHERSAATVPRQKWLPMVAGACSFALIATLGSAAQASGFLSGRFGGERGHPTTDNPTAIYYNPAGIAQNERLQLYLDASAIYLFASYHHPAPPGGSPTDVPEPPGFAGANYGTATASGFGVSPSLSASARIQLNEDVALAFGAGAFIPYGGGIRWDKNEAFEGNRTYVGPVDGVQRYWSIEASIATIYGSGAVAVSLFDRVYLGLSGGVAYTTIAGTQALAGDGSNDLDLEGRTLLTASAINGHIGGGVIVEALPKQLWLGLSYQAPPGITSVRARGSFQRYLPPGILSGDRSPEDDIDAYQSYPDVFRFGVRYRPIPKLELRLFGDVTRWSLLDAQCASPADEPCELNPDGSAKNNTIALGSTPRDWNDAFGVRFGGSYFPHPRVEVFVGIGYDSNAVPTETLEPSAPDYDDIAETIGGRFQLTEAVQVSLAYTHFFYFPRNSIGKSVRPDYAPGARTPDPGGVYKQTAGMFLSSLYATFDAFGSGSSSNAEPDPAAPPAAP